MAERQRAMRASLPVAAAALFLGFFGAGKAYRADEVWSLRTIALPWDQMMAEIRGDIHPPLYYWMLDGWMQITGDSEIAVRSLSILFYLITIAIAWAAARDLIGSRGAPVAAAIVAISPLATLGAQFVRMYSLMTLAAMLSTWMYLRLATRDPASRRDLAFYIFANIAGSFTHVWFFFLLLGQGLTHLAFYRLRRLPRLLLAAVLSLAPYMVLWLPVLLAQVRKTQSALAWVPEPALSALVESVWLWGGGFWLTVPILLFLARRRRGQPNLNDASIPAWPPVLIALITLLAPFLISQIKPVFWPRFTIVALPAFAIAAARLAAPLRLKHLDKVILLLGVVLLTGAAQFESKCDGRNGAAFLRQHIRSGDWVVFSSLSRPPVEYYLDRSGSPGSLQLQSFPAEIDAHPGHEGNIHTVEARPKLAAEAAALAASFRNKAQPGARLFFLHGFRPQTDAIPLKQFNDQLVRQNTPVMECATIGSYFNQIEVFSLR